ncbi:MAG: PAS domain S-box protein [Chloroflexaceae bacterium]|nr:PAS domain S-box protein [Chloroflexaceae bacterium]
METNQTTIDTLQQEKSQLQQRIALLEQRLAEHDPSDTLLQAMTASQPDKQSHMLRVLVDHAPDGIALSTMDGTITYANARYQATHGYGPEIIGMSMDDLIPNADALQSAFQTLREHGAWQGLISHQRRDGSTFQVMASCFTIYDEHSNPLGLAAIDHDMTAIRQAEQQIQQSQTLLQVMLDNLPLVAYAVDNDGRLALANQQWSQAVGIPLEQAIGTSMIELFGDETGAAWTAAYENILKQGEVNQREEVFAQADGLHTYLSARFPLRDAAGRIYGMGGISTDITERKQLEERLQLAQMTLERTADMVLWSNLNAQYVYVNDAACNELGYTREALLALTAFDLDPHLSPERLEQMAPLFQQHGSIRIESELCHNDGTLLPVDITLSMIAVGEQTYVCTVARNIRLQKEQEAERAALQQQIIDTQRDTLRQLSTPLIPISNNALIMPLIGSIDDQRAQQVLEALLEGVAQHRAECVILDITGVSVVDTQVAQALISAAQAVKLLGAQVILTGIQPQIAQTLVHLGIDLSSMSTRSSLQAGIAAVLR